MERDFVGRGWPFPIRLSGRRLSFIGGEDKIRQSIWIILSTAPRERQMLPEFGCGIHDLVFQPNTAALRGLLQESVRTALQRWEPRIDILNVRVETRPEERNHLWVYIDYRNRSDNSLYNLVYPFYLNEGPG